MARGLLREAGDGSLSYELRRAWRDGTRAVLLEPLEIRERLVALVPAARRHLVRHHGTLAPSARRRRWIVPAAGDGRRRARPRPSGEPRPAPERAVRSSAFRGAYRGAVRADGIPWAELMRRVLAKDVLECPRCGGRMRVGMLARGGHEPGRHPPDPRAPRLAGASASAGAGAPGGRGEGGLRAGARRAADAEACA